jgi:hypothetical protein
VRNCIESQRHVSNATYLKTPKVFGFTGIFRRLATQAMIVDDDIRLDDGGWELLRAFEKDEQLPGLVDGAGAGADLVRELRDAVREGMERGHTTSRSQLFWERVARHLLPIRTRRRERAVLFDRLRATHELSREIIDDLRDRQRLVNREDEASYLRDLAQRVTPNLRQLLGAIDAYETLCRPIIDAFTVVRYLSTKRGQVGAADFAKAPQSDSLVQRVREGCHRVSENGTLLDLEPDVRHVLDAFEDTRTAGDLFAAVVARHERAQAEKPPDGKRPWLEHGASDKVLVRPLYRVAELPEDQLPYVHDYRIRTVGRFLEDLGVFA